MHPLPTDTDTHHVKGEHLKNLEAFLNVMKDRGFYGSGHRQVHVPLCRCRARGPLYCACALVPLWGPMAKTVTCFSTQCPTCLQMVPQLLEGPRSLPPVLLPAVHAEGAVMLRSPAVGSLVAHSDRQNCPPPPHEWGGGGHK